MKGSARSGKAITFGLSIKNGGSTSAKLTLTVAGKTVKGYSVRYLRGATDITAAVVAGTWKTPQLAPGAATLVTVRVSVTSQSLAGSKVVRTLTVGAPGAPATDVAKVTGARS